MADEARRFSEAEVDAILRRAIARHEQSEGLSRGELVEALGQLGVGEAELDAAIEAHDVDAEVERLLGVWRARQYERIRRLAVGLAAITVTLGLVNLLTGPAVLWFLWPALGWAVGLGLAAWRTRTGPGDAVVAAWRRAAEAQAAKAKAEAEARAEEARRREKGDRLRKAGTELGDAVRATVTEVLESLGSALRGDGAQAAKGGDEASDGRTGVRVAEEPEVDVEDDLAELRARVEHKRRGA